MPRRVARRRAPPGRPRAGMKRLVWLGGALVGLVAIGSATAVPGEVGSLPIGRKVTYVVAALAAGLVYAGAVAALRSARRGQPIVLILAVAAALRAITFATPPLLSTDLF